ncbi:DUF6671 family protein [Pedobacter cryotolerans]|uniref:DUF6671 domain-containing protein n=1 Tax=Pedobacter cryotolerans TaxID=2571270 RepID=A0A4U1C270_9SPHI|nr:DUF6671 family protein [Pedobacter cryotolerans]TKB99292.1 hypothetical protein FA045_12440 [Pedobacter cryotolerans]
MFKGRRLLIATKHQKESVIAPIMQRELGVNCFVWTEFDSDLLGTFTGEVERTDDALTTVKNKCLQAMALANCDLAIASEGSFGAHPTLFFAHADEEILIFIDQKNGLEITVSELSLSTNFNAAMIACEDELRAFAADAGFSSHGLIIRKQKEDLGCMVKGITDSDLLISSYHMVKLDNWSAYVETDMRAMFNPTRMRVIETAAQKLADKIKSLCPSCQMPGFAAVEAKQGLPCELCRFPTRSTLAHIYRCAHCHFSLEKKYPHGKENEDPKFCDLCNP